MSTGKVTTADLGGSKVGVTYEGTTIETPETDYQLQHVEPDNAG